MDAFLQLLLAKTWQHTQSDGLIKLTKLSKMIRHEIDAHAKVFESERERSLALSQILRALQVSKEYPETSGPTLVHQHWTILPLDIDLADRHRQTERQHFHAVAHLISTTTAFMQSRPGRQVTEKWVDGAIRAMGEDLSLPIFIPALTDLIIHFATRPGRLPIPALNMELQRYRKTAIELASNRKVMIRAQIVSDLRPMASGIDLQIDQSFDWDQLTNHAKDTTLSALRYYAQLNANGHVSDARFSHNAMLETRMSRTEFAIFTPKFIRAMTISMQGRDLRTRTMEKTIIDTERSDVRVNDRRVRKSLILVIPYDEPDFDIELHLALSLQRLDMKSRQHKEAQSEDVHEWIPESLHPLIEAHGMRRKIVHNKKTMLFCLAGLLAENIYRYRAQYTTTLQNGTLLKTRAHADEYTAELLRKYGFHYSAESLRRGRSRFRKDFLDRVPIIFGLAAKSPRKIEN